MINVPWLDFYDNVPHHLNYPDISIVQLIEKTAKDYPQLVAYEFLGIQKTYSEFIAEVSQCAKALRALGIKEDDRVTICLPNVPQAVIMFYAINMIGAISNMIHPLASEGEIEFYLRDSNSVAAITLDAFYSKFSNIIKETDVKYLIITSIKDRLSGIKSLGYRLTKGRKIKPVPATEGVFKWNEFLAGGEKFNLEYKASKKGADPAVILYSGGTTGITKGILLTNLNFNALAMQTTAMGDCLVPGDSMLSIMPVFHGFGLGIGIHTMLFNACKCILIPAFNAQGFGTLLKKNQPNFIAGVPTLYEALLKSDKMEKIDLSCLKGVFSGGDTLSVELKKKVDVYLKEHNAKVQIREGYGTTECVTASCLTPKNYFREGSIGLPFPDMYYKIVKPNTQKELPFESEGEICISGPTVMLGYVGNPKETSQTLQFHPDGMTWMHTGDLGYMDKDGFVYFKQRLKRMIISSGYSIYPSQLENVIDSHPDVLMSTVIGVDDSYKMQKVKAFIVLKPSILPTDKVKESIRTHCEKNIAKYAMPYEFEYRESLPKTLVGKVAYTILEAEEKAKAR